MRKRILWSSVLMGGLALIMLTTTNDTAHAAVYCKYVGFPKGCVVRTGVVLAPAPVVYCQYVGVPAGCVARAGVVLAPAPVVRAATPGFGAPGIGVAPGVPGNRGGPVNRVGRR